LNFAAAVRGFAKIAKNFGDSMFSAGRVELPKAATASLRRLTNQT